MFSPKFTNTKWIVLFKDIILNFINNFFHMNTLAVLQSFITSNSLKVNVGEPTAALPMVWIYRTFTYITQIDNFFQELRENPTYFESRAKEENTYEKRGENPPQPSPTLLEIFALRFLEICPFKVYRAFSNIADKRQGLFWSKFIPSSK